MTALVEIDPLNTDGHIWIAQLVLRTLNDQPGKKLELIDPGRRRLQLKQILSHFIWIAAYGITQPTEIHE